MNERHSLHERMSVGNPDFQADIQAVRAAVLRLRDSDDLLGFDPRSGGQEEGDDSNRRLSVRRCLVSELIDFLDAREDIVDLQVRNGLDPLALLLGDETEA